MRPTADSFLQQTPIDVGLQQDDLTEVPLTEVPLTTLDELHLDADSGRIFLRDANIMRSAPGLPRPPAATADDIRLLSHRKLPLVPALSREAMLQGLKDFSGHQSSEMPNHLWPCVTDVKGPIIYPGGTR